MAKTKISILLIKEGVTFENVLKSDNLKTINLPNGMSLYYKSTLLQIPKWVKSFFKGDLDKKTALMTKTISAVLLYKIKFGDDETRIFAVCFGYGRSLLNSDVEERRFGLRVTLNKLSDKDLRSVDVNVLGNSGLKTRNQTAVLSDIVGLNVDTEISLLRSVAGRPKDDDDWGSLLNGADNLSLNTDYKYNNLEEFLRKCYETYKKDNYKKNFEWIDHICQIKEKNKINKLEEKLDEELRNDAQDKIWISIPDILDYDEPFTFKIEKKNQRVITEEEEKINSDDFSIQELKDRLGDMSVVSLKSHNLECIVGDVVKRYWKLYRCISAEIELDEDSRYLLTDGEWFEVNKSYVEDVTSRYNQTNVCKLNFPNYKKGTREGEYNKELSQKCDYILMDMKLIQIKGMSKVEFCDVLTKDHDIVHVKKNSGSAALSHLFNQGLVSAQLTLESDFRRDVNEKIKVEELKLPEDEAGFKSNDYKIVFVVITKEFIKEGLPRIPFFSMVSYLNVAKQIKNFGYDVSIKGVKIEEVN